MLFRSIENAKVLGIVGPGVINTITIETFAALRPSLDTLKIKGRGKASIDRCIEYVKEKCPQFKNIIVCDTLEECVKDSDILSFATSTPMGSGASAYPYVKKEWIKPGALFCLPGAASFDDSLLFNENTKLVVDNIKLYEAWAEEYPYPTFGPITIIGSKFTDMVHDGKISASKIDDLGDIIKGTKAGRESEDQIIMYSVGGMPVEDVAWGKVVYENALKLGIGTKLPLWDAPAFC